MNNNKFSLTVFPFTLGIGSMMASCMDVKNEITDSPNVVIINVDDLGYGDLGCYGATKVRTPNVDRLAAQGRLFTDAHAASAVSSPSRYGLITGEYPLRQDLWHPVFLRDTLRIDTAKMTIARVMKKSGYATACIGKWHLGFQKTYPVDWNKELKPGPLELGFDYYFGIPVVNSHPPFVFIENHHVVGFESEDPFVYGENATTQPFEEKFALGAIGGAKKAHALFKDREVGTSLKNKAIEWVKANKDKPFFLYWATTNIHHPFTPAEQFVGTSEAGRYGDFIHELDWMIGEFLDMLDEQKLTDNTLVILTSDNGGMLNLGGQDAWRSGHRMNGKLLGFKFDAWEGGHRIPFIARWPGKILAGSTSGKLLCNVDLLSTMAALTGLMLKHGEGPDSYNMLPAFTDEPEMQIRDHIIIAPYDKKHLSIRKGKWMYIPARDGGGFDGINIGDHHFGGAAAFKLTNRINSDIDDGKIKEGAPPAQLYNLETDPYETVNVIRQYPEIAKTLHLLLQEKTNP